jgi:hypothetical protein
MKPLRRTLLCALLPALALSACDESPSEPGSDLPYTISGTLDNRTGAPVPTGTRVLVAWEVSSGSPDYTYVFGEGTVRANGAGFELTFDAPPPARALNSNGLGVGIVFLTTDTGLRAGDDVSRLNPAAIVGAAGQFAVIYLDRAPAEVGSWAAKFQPGYNVGRGIDLPGSFDGFEPVSPFSVEIIIDDLENIDFVNWT